MLISKRLRAVLLTKLLQIEADAKMPLHCTLVDPLHTRGIIQPYGLGPIGVPMFECIRLLMGTVDVENNKTRKTIKLRKCFVTQSIRRQSNKTLPSLVRTIFDGDLSVEDFGVYLTKGKNENRGFWEKVKGELCLCLVAETSGQHLHAFLHLYRAIELISLALPLVYASTEPDYMVALSLLKSLNTNDGGDLAVLKSLSKHIAKTGGYEELSIEYDFKSTDAFWRSEASKQFNKYVLGPAKIGNIREDKSGFDVKFSNISSLLVNTRNRAFHRMIGAHSFDLDKLNGIDDICQTVTGPTLYWLSLIIIEILKSHSTRFV